MCAIEALDGVKKKVNPAVANFAANQSIQADNKMMAYEIKKKELIASGMPPEKASKMANEYIKTLGTSVNSTNNKTDTTVGTSRQERERTEGATNVDGTAVTAHNIRTGDSTNTQGNNDSNMGGDRSTDKLDVENRVREFQESSTIDKTDLTKSFNPALRRIAKRLEFLTVTLTPQIRKALESLEENDPRSLKPLAEKLERMNKPDVLAEMAALRDN